MREDLKTARRSLGFLQHLVLSEHLGQVEELLGLSEAVQAVAPGWWRGHRSLVVATTSRLLLVRRHAKGSSANHAAFTYGRIGQLSVHATPDGGARFRFSVGLDREEFSVTGCAVDIERALHTSLT